MINSSSEIEMPATRSNAWKSNTRTSLKTSFENTQQGMPVVKGTM